MIWNKIVFLSMAIASMALIISRGKILAGFRQAAENSSTFFGELINCMLCVSFWLSLITVSVCGPVRMSHSIVADFVFNVFVLISGANIIGGLISKLN